MRALAYTRAHELSDFSITLQEVPQPQVRDHDLLVEVRAVSVNPVDYKIRSSRAANGNVPVILGWDAAGVVRGMGSAVKGFSLGDEVYYAGDLLRDGSNAEFQAVDFRLVGKKPNKLSLTEAAAIPLTALTAWEALFEKMALDKKPAAAVLVIGGAGGVGSMAIQLLKARTKAVVIATASRNATRDWCRAMGADIVIDYKSNLLEELKKHGFAGADAVLSTTATANYLSVLPDLIEPFGDLCLIDDPEVFDIASFKKKSISIHWELMFTKSLYGHRLSSQGEILQEVASLVDSGKIRSTANVVLSGLTPDSIRQAHELLESGRSIGKIVIDFAKR